MVTIYLTIFLRIHNYIIGCPCFLCFIMFYYSNFITVIKLTTYYTNSPYICWYSVHQLFYKYDRIRIGIFIERKKEMFNFNFYTVYIFFYIFFLVDLSRIGTCSVILLYNIFLYASFRNRNSTCLLQQVSI